MQDSIQKLQSHDHCKSQVSGEKNYLEALRQTFIWDNDIESATLSSCIEEGEVIQEHTCIKDEHLWRGTSVVCSIIIKIAQLTVKSRTTSCAAAGMSVGVIDMSIPWVRPLEGGTFVRPSDCFTKCISFESSSGSGCGTEKRLVVES